MLARGASIAMLVLAPWMLSAGWARACAESGGHVQQDAPVVRIPLDPMGYQTLIPRLVNDGSSMVSVDYVDKDHLLVTFGVHRLMRRDANRQSSDSDRLVDARLVEIASGKVLAETEWQLHDHGQYLWPLGSGRFLFRVRDQLSVLEPMQALKEQGGMLQDGAFHEYAFLHSDRKLVAVAVSPEQDLLTIETAAKEEVKLGDAQGEQAPVLINFYRLRGAEAGQEMVSSAGTVKTSDVVMLPLTTAGYLQVLQGKRDHWLFNFNSYAGPVDELAGFDTTCYPHVVFVSHSEFVAFGCRGSVDRQDIAGFNLKGEAMWQQNFFDAQLAPNFAFAPGAGRFALERTVVRSSNMIDPSNLGAMLDDGSTQEIRVYQTYSGRVAFQIDVSPVVRAGQNFALSPDGTQLAVVEQALVHHNATKDDAAYTDTETAVEIYALPMLSDKDQAAVREAQAMSPRETGERIDAALYRIQGKAGAAVQASEPPGGGTLEEQRSVSTGQSSTPVADMGDTSQGAATASASAVGDTDAAGPRKPPTLYGPGESPKH